MLRWHRQLSADMEYEGLYPYDSSCPLSDDRALFYGIPHSYHHSQKAVRQLHQRLYRIPVSNLRHLLQSVPDFQEVFDIQNHIFPNLLISICNFVK